jgi:hypothetical protein
MDHDGISIHKCTILFRPAQDLSATFSISAQNSEKISFLHILA